MVSPFPGYWPSSGASLALSERGHNGNETDRERWKVRWIIEGGVRFVCCPRNRNALPSVCLFPTGLNVTLNDQFPAKRIESACPYNCTRLHLCVFSPFHFFGCCAPYVTCFSTPDVLPLQRARFLFSFFFFPFICSSILTVDAAIVLSFFSTFAWLQRGNKSTFLFILW